MTWLSNWNRRKSKTITGSSIEQSNYQLKIIVHKDSGEDTSTDVYCGGNCKNDFGDIRFTLSDGNTLLSYWIESFIPGSSAIIWIKIPSIPTPGTSIYIYYDNPSAISASNGDNTFELFDDFNDNTIDTNKWILDSPEPSSIDTKEQNNRLEQTGTVIQTAKNTFLRSVNTTFQNFVVEFIHNQVSGSGDANWEDSEGPFLFRITNWNREQAQTSQFNFSGTAYGLSHNRRDAYNDFASSFRIDRYANSPVTSIINRQGVILNQNTNYRIKLAVNGNSISAYRDDILLINITDNNILGPGGLAFRGRLGDGSGTGTINNTFDDFRVRKYISPEPTFSISGIEEAIGTVNISSVPSGAEIFIDGIDQLIVTPATIGLSGGNHSFRLTLAGFPDVIGTFTIIIGQTTTVSIPMQSSVGSLNIVSNPPTARIFIDDIDQNIISPATIGGISPGQHSFRLTLAGYLDNTGSFSIVADTTTEISVQMTSITGSVNISSAPSGALIFIDNINQNVVTPKVITGLLPGQHTYKLTLSTYQDKTGFFTINSGQTTTISVTLIPVGITPGIKNGTFDQGLANWQSTGHVEIGTEDIGSGPSSAANLYFEFYGSSTIQQTFVIDKCFIQFDYKSRNDNDGYELYIDNQLFAGRLLPDQLGRELIDVSNFTDHLAMILFFNRGSGFGQRLTLDNITTLSNAYDVSIESFPTGAQIFLDGIDTGLITKSTTPVIIDTRSEGSHTITLKLSNFTDYTETINVITCQPLSISAIFEGCIRLITNPEGANICINDIDSGLVTPSVICGNLVNSSVKYGLVLKKYTKKSDTIIIQSGKGHLINETLSRETGSINFTSNPAGSHIFIDGIDTGLTTPNIVNNVLTGIRNCTLSLDGYYSYNILINIDPNDIRTVSATLEKSTSYQPQSINNGTFNTDLNGWLTTTSGNGVAQWDNGTVHLFGNSGAGADIYQDFTITEPIISFIFKRSALNSYRDAGYRIIVDGNVVRSDNERTAFQWIPYEVDVTEFIGKTARINFFLSANLIMSQTSDIWIDNVANTPKLTRLITLDTKYMAPYNPCQKNPKIPCPSADVYIDNILKGKTPLNVNDITVGSHPYAIRKIGYKDFDTGNDDVLGEIPIIPAESMLTLITHTFESKTPLPSIGCVTFDSIPPGAKIFINGINTGKRTPDTICNIDQEFAGMSHYTLSTLSMLPILSILPISSLSPGQFSYKILLPHYYEKIGSFITNNLFGEKIIEELFPKIGNISFDSIPRGARIILDGVDTGRVTPDFFEGVLEGLHTYDLTLANFNTYSCNIKMVTNQTFNVNPFLIPSEGCIYLDSCPRSRVFIDDFDTGIDTPYLSCGNTGHHKLTLSRIGYEDYIEEVDMPVGGGINRKINLIRKIGVPFLDPTKHICKTPGIALVPYSPVPLDGQSQYYGKDSIKTAHGDGSGSTEMIIIDVQGFNTMHLRALFYRGFIGGDPGVINIYQTDSLGDCLTGTIPPDVDTLFSANAPGGWYLQYLFDGSLNISKRYIIIQLALSATIPGYVEFDVMESIPLDCPSIVTTTCQLATIQSILTISSFPSIINANTNSQITLHAEDEYGVTLQSSNITLSVTSGILNPISGITDTNGDFISTYTAPNVPDVQTITITGNVSKTGHTGSTASTQVVVTPTGYIPILTSIDISPPTVNILVGHTQQFEAVCKDQNNIVIACPVITWESSDITKGTISDTGLFTGKSEGTVTVTATIGSITDSSQVTITRVVEAGPGNIGSLLIGGLLFGLLVSKKCSDYKTKEECEKKDCKWINNRCIRKNKKSSQ